MKEINLYKKLMDQVKDNITKEKSDIKFEINVIVYYPIVGEAEMQLSELPNKGDKFLGYIISRVERCIAEFDGDPEAKIYLR